MASVATPVSVVTTTWEDEHYGATVSAFSSLSMDPPMVLVSLDHRSTLLTAITTDPVLSRCKLIAEPWDATGEGYRVGGTTFAHGTRSAGELAAQWRGEVSYSKDAEEIARTSRTLLEYTWNHTTLVALGLRHHQAVVVQQDSPSLRGQLKQVRHLVKVTPVEE